MGLPTVFDGKEKVLYINERRECPNIWSSPRYGICPKKDTGHSVCQTGRPFFSLLLIKVGKDCNNCADHCCYTCNNSDKPVKIHCKVLPSNYSTSFLVVRAGRQPPVQALPSNTLYFKTCLLYIVIVIKKHSAHAR